MFKLMLLMAMGLGALYMMHLLAQDYNKIRQPVAAAARALVSTSNLIARVKREVFEENSQYQKWWDPKDDMTAENVRNKTTLNIDWKRILSRDPFECLLSLICQLAAGAENNSHEAKFIIEFLENTIASAPGEIRLAFSRGLTLHGGTDHCYNIYPFCVYSAKTMLRVLRWFTESPLEEES
ncbi:uncharacterized protein LOC101449459 [Ceratitis capitata]|uniref:(Mediterranean fruit fly) hypothetical protein n=1 Tax=Ceratitis capitata TaxID=7213 RepID=A0A811UMR4_CERCA|nr:uncharacterized protein LOC101449459 [Ceratitis capitata]CAD6998373.1 unnamed protein product [Ceratitis capitata]